MQKLAISFTASPEEMPTLQDAAKTLGCPIEEMCASQEPRASIDLLSPGAVVVFAATAYFGGLLAELGKRHAPSLDRVLIALYRIACAHLRRILRASDSTNPFQAHTVPKRGNVGPAIVIFLKDPDQRSMRFIFPGDLSDQDLEAAIGDFPSALKGAVAERESNEPVAGVPSLTERAYVYLPSEGWQRLEVIIAEKLRRG